MKSLLILTAAMETATGLALLGLPLLVVTVLFRGALDTPAAQVVARVAGAALLALGVACWLARNDEKSRAAFGLVTAMLLYNAAAATLLAYAGIGEGLSGVGLWPAILVHTVLAVWCVVCLRASRMNP